MSHPSINSLPPEMMQENNLSIAGYLKQSHTPAIKHSPDKTFLFKQEVGFYDEVGPHDQRMLLPVNNFLKDFSRIEEEFLEESNIVTASIIPIEQALACDKMEENY